MPRSRGARKPERKRTTGQPLRRKWPQACSSWHSSIFLYGTAIVLTRPSEGRSDSNDFSFDRPDGRLIHPKYFRLNQIVFAAVCETISLVPVQAPKWREVAKDS